MLFYCVVIEILTHNRGKRQIDVFHLESFHIITVSRRETAGTSCFSLPRMDAVASAGADTKHQYRQTGGSYFSTFNFSKSIAKDTTYYPIRVFWSCYVALWDGCISSVLFTSVLVLFVMCFVWCFFKCYISHGDFFNYSNLAGWLVTSFCGVTNSEKFFFLLDTDLKGFFLFYLHHK